MKTWFTTVKYAPNPDREEYFGIGLILVSPEIGAVKVRFSRDRVTRINRALDIEKSSLLESAMHQAEGLAKSREPLDIKHLEYLSVYENGVIRYATPKPLVIAHDNPDESADDLLEQRFDRLYHKLIADKEEDGAKRESKGSALGTIFRQKARVNRQLSTHLDIGYNVQHVHELNSSILLPEVRLDFIGGNGSIYCGHFLDLHVSESTLSKNISETLNLYECLNHYYNTGQQSGKKEQKLILDKNQYGSKGASKALEMIRLITKDKPYELKEVEDINRFMCEVQEEVQSMNVEPFTTWITKHSPKHLHNMQ